MSCGRCTCSSTPGQARAGEEVFAARPEADPGPLAKPLEPERPGLVDAANIDDRFKDRSAEWIVKTAERFYTGLGFSPLPEAFWTLSDLYPVKR